MKKESTTKPPVGSMTRTVLIFLFGGFILTVAVYAINDICGIVWIDFVHYNPHRSQAHALQLIAMSPITGLILTLYYSLPVIVGAMVAAVFQRILGRIPFYSLAVMLPICVFTLYKQIPSRPIPIEYTDILGLFILQLPVVVGCWWWNNRTSKN
ncbi:hypothetical protein [Sporomusa sp.]|uniref:hypothetical protein n=1 Tax=Sporomusa sp. TaxID=2078658 RepID=UPI002C08385F|nr:hypothetical protein [Sporomusa sp.]HWR42548.1 hypothetical protein [Sporomusa sp.]